MKIDINQYTITSNMKKCNTKDFYDLSEKEQRRILEEYSYIEDIKECLFVKSVGEEYEPTDAILNFEVNTIPREIRDYFYNKFPGEYCGVGNTSVYLSGSIIYVVDEYQESYLRFFIN